MKNILLLLILACFVSCGKSKDVLMYDESKGSQNSISYVQIPNDIELLKIDGKTFDKPFSNNILNLHLTAGNHIFLVRYYCMWKTPSGDYYLIKSPKIEISLDMEKDKSYQLMHRKINDYETALACEKEPGLHFIVTAKDSKITDIATPANSKPDDSKLVKQKKKEENDHTNSKTNYLDALKYMYENSSEEDKKEFLKWIEKEKK